MSPESTEVPKSVAEQQYEKRFASEAQFIISDQIQADAEGDDSIDRVGIFVDRLIQDAESGNIKTSKGEKIDGAQMMSQLESFLLDRIKADDPTNTEAVRPYVNIPRTGGVQDAFKQFESSPISDRFIKTLHERTGLPMPEKQGEHITLSEAQKVGGEVLDAVGAVEPIPDENPMEKARNAAVGIIDAIPAHILNPRETAPQTASIISSEGQSGTVTSESTAEVLSPDQLIDKLTDGFSLEDKSALYAYAAAIMAFQRAEHQREYANAADAKRDRYDAQQRMSPAARAVASQYVNYSYAKNTK